MDVGRNGCPINIRSLRPDDRADLVAAFKRVSPQSVYRRFFAVRRDFSDKEIAFFTDVDFDKHVVLVASIDEGGQQAIVAAGRYVVMAPGRAEVAFTVIDAYQGQGIGSALLRHIIGIAQQAGLSELVAEILAENTPMQRLFANCGFATTVRRQQDVVHMALDLRHPTGCASYQ